METGSVNGRSRAPLPPRWGASTGPAARHARHTTCWAWGPTWKPCRRRKGSVPTYTRRRRPSESIPTSAHTPSPASAWKWEPAERRSPDARRYVRRRGGGSGTAADGDRSGGGGTPTRCCWMAVRNGGSKCVSLARRTHTLRRYPERRRGLDGRTSGVGGQPRVRRVGGVYSPPRIPTHVAAYACPGRAWLGGWPAPRGAAAASPLEDGGRGWVVLIPRVVHPGHHHIHRG